MVIGPNSSFETISSSMDRQAKQVGKSINFDMATPFRSLIKALWGKQLHYELAGTLDISTKVNVK